MALKIINQTMGELSFKLTKIDPVFKFLINGE